MSLKLSLLIQFNFILGPSVMYFLLVDIKQSSTALALNTM